MIGGVVDDVVLKKWPASLAGQNLKPLFLLDSVELIKFFV